MRKINTTVRMRISTKQEMYALYNKGAFGNRLKTWPSLDAWQASGFDRPVVLRYSGSGGGSQFTAYGLQPHEVIPKVAEFIAQGALRENFAVNELGQDEDLIFQGEVRRSENYLDMRYSTVPKPMRIALAEDQKHISGLQALMLLKAHMDPASFDFLWELFDTYDSPDTVIEFSVWNTDIGSIPRRNTVFWEVRNY